MRRTALWLPLALIAVLAMAAPSTAGASALVVRNAKYITLKVDRYNRALVSYTANGTVHHTLWWGAINAKPPDPAHPQSQVKFRYDYSGGSGSFGNGYWRNLKNVCTPWKGSGLTWVVVACTMPDGSHWALQRWRRLMPNGGWPCCLKPGQGAYELHVSHWKGVLPQFWLKWDWTSGSPHLDELYGRSSYKGIGTYGFSSTSTGAPTDSYGRLVYVDGFNPPKWGKGWRRENSFLVHRPSDGGFCDALWPNRYGRTNASGYAMKYRASVDGPGVMPVMYWQGPPPGNYPASTGEGRDGLAIFTVTGSTRLPYDATLDAILNDEIRTLAGSSADKCWNLW
jgi:hypothetical protein